MPAEHHFLKALTLRLKGNSEGVPANLLDTRPAWDQVWAHPRLLQWNRLDPRGSYGYDDVGVKPICPLNGFVSGDTFIHDNPSSQVMTAGVGNLQAPFRLGKPLIFRGQMTLTNGATKNEISPTFNDSGYVTETGGAGGFFNDTATTEIYTDLAAAAYGLQTRILGAGGGLTGWVRVTYEDPRRGSTLFAFKIESEYPLTLGHNGTSGLWHTFGLAHRVGISATTHQGDRILHEREFIIWDTAGQAGTSDRGGGPSGPTFFQGQRDAVMPCWFVLPDCNFLPVTCDRNAYTRGDPSEEHYSGGAPRLALLASDSLDDLELDWNDPAKFTEGVNMFTFCRYYWPGSPGGSESDGWPDNGNMIHKTLGRCWGVDGAGSFLPGGRLPPVVEDSGVYGGVAPDTVGGNWPNRMLTAHLWKWAWYMGEDAWGHWVSTSAAPPNYRYWMLLIVNRHNPLGRIAIGGPPWLDPGWIPLTMPHMRYYDAVMDRSYALTNEFGDKLPIERSGQRIVRARWSGPQRLHALDHRIFNHAALRRRIGQPSKFPHLHALRVARGKLLGRAAPCIYIDPLYDQSGDRRTFPTNGDDPFGDWDGHGRYAPRYNSSDNPGTDETDGDRPGPPQRLNWKQEGAGTFKAESAGLDMSLYARGTILGYAEWFNWKESGLPDKTYNADLMVSEIPEEY
jgi:hypothetical protein